MITFSRWFRRIRNLNRKTVAFSILLVLLVGIVAGSAYYSLSMQSNMTVSSPPVELQEGTAGNSIIYTGNTSAKVSVGPTGVSGIDVEDFVDNNTSDVDNSTDFGTHGNFTAQQFGPDLVNDTLTETSPSSEWLDSNAYDSTYQDWTINGTSPYLDAQDQPTNYVYIITTDLGQRIGWFDFPNTTLTGNLYVNISIYGNNDDGIGDDYADVFVDYTGNGSGSDVGDVAQHTGWQYDTIDLGVRTVSEINNLRVYFEYQRGGSADEVRIDHVRIGVNIYSQLDLEVQWTNVDYDEENELLCIYGGTMSAENLTVDVWYNSTWQNVFTNLSSGWNNVSVSSYLDSSNFSIRFKGGNETGDTTQTTWDIDATLLHVWTEPAVDYVDNNTSNVDSSDDQGTHSNFTAQQYGPDLVNDTLTEDIGERWDYADDNTGNVDGSADKGTHSNFTAQQYGPDSINDTLMEENTGTVDTLWLYVNADDENQTQWTRVGTNPYLNATDYPTNFVNASGNNLNVGNFSFTDSGKSTEVINSVEVQLYARESVSRDLEVFVWNGSSWTSLGFGLISTSWGWINWTATTLLDTWTKIDAARMYIRTRSATGTYEVDSARLKIDYFVTNNYELDREVAWFNADFDETNEELCIYGGSMGAENITVDVWNGTGWENLFTDLNSGWNNVSVSSYLTSSEFSIRFKGGNETGDANQDTWNIDVTLIHVWGGVAYYDVDLEVQWTSATYKLVNEELCIYTGTTDAEDIKVDVWNGSAWINIFADLTANSWNNISVTSYLNSSTFTIRFKGGNETGDTTQDTWNIDAVLLNVWEVDDISDFNYVLKFVEKDNFSWKVRLIVYDNSSMGRLDNCSIYIYNGSNSTQIVILNGDYENQTGPWIDLNATDTEYIWMHAETSSAGTSTVYVYLEIRVPNKTVYARYVILFEIN